MTFFKRIKSKLCKNCSSKVLIGYKDLAPHDNIPDGNAYLEALDWAIDNPRIYNIALTGPYGSGKSSVIQSYLKSHPNLKAVNVSFAAFQENSSEGTNVGAPDSNAIEEGILKQLFYRVSHKDIPQSRYRKLHRIDLVGTMSTIGGVFILAALLSYVFLPEQFSFFVDLILQAGTRHGLSQKLTATLAVGTFVVLDYILAKLYRRLLGKIRLKEVKLPANTTIVPENGGENSVFNRNLDEIIYYFEEMKYDIVFFEDLDRLNNAEIFVKLRELNLLLNNDQAIKKSVKFVYAVRDDIFTDTDRTKFFEFIIPIVPIINSTNSGEALARLIGEGSVDTNISAEYIMDISPFVSDMRLLQNAYNEFLIYKKTLQSGQSLNLEDQAMLSLVIFKNLYPKEFADLQAERGVVKQAFTDKISVIEKLRHELQEDIDTSSSLLEGLQNDLLKSRRELVASFFCAVTNWDGYAYIITISGRSYRFDDFLNPEFDFDEIIVNLNENVHVSGSYHTFTGNGGYSFNTSIPREAFEVYAKRFRYIATDVDEKADALRKDIEEKTQRLYAIGGYSLKKLIEVFGVDQVLSENVRSIHPLVYMLRMGYIDERYADYINYFKGTSITTADMNFILSIKNHEALPFSYELNKINQIVSRLQPHEFEQEEIFNFDLLEFLLGDDTYKEKRARFMVKMADGTEKSWQFLDEFAGKTQHRAELFHDISSAWPMLWDHVVSNVVLTREKKNFYLTMILTYADIKDIVAQDTNGNLSSYCVESISILKELSNVPANKLVKVIDELKIRFVDVDLTDVNKTVAYHIIDVSSYDICIPMLQRVVEFLNPDLMSNLRTKNYTTLLRMNYQPVLDYVHENWGKYIHEIILSQNNTEEISEVIVKLLGKTLPDTTTCIKLISHQNFVLDNLVACTFSDLLKDKNAIAPLWNQMILEDKLAPVWSNVITYWNRLGLTEELLRYVERNASHLVEDNSIEVDEGFVREYLISHGDNDSYRALTSRLNLREFDLPIAEIPEDRVAILIDTRYFAFSIDIYNQVRSAYPELALNVILQNQSECISLMKSIAMDSDTLAQLIHSEQASAELKASLLKAFGESYMSEAVANELCNHTYSISNKVFFVAWDFFNGNEKKEFMYNYLSILKAEDFERCFSDIEEFRGLCERTRHNVELHSDSKNQQLAKRLQDVGYITSWKSEVRAQKITVGSKTRTEYHEVIVCVVKSVK